MGRIQGGLVAQGIHIDNQERFRGGTMKGHKELIELRMRGKVPKVVYLETGKLPIASGGDATVWLDQGDMIDRLDLRFLGGLEVTVEGDDQAIVKAAEQAAIKAGAKRVEALVYAPRVTQEQTYFHAISHTDTQGGYSWHA